MIQAIDTPCAWRDGQWLVLRKSSPVGPDRCIVTNEPTFGHRKFSRLLSWGNNGAGNAWVPTKLQIMFALANMKFFRVEVGLSEIVKMKRLTILLVSFSLMVSGIALFVFGITRGFPPQMLPMGSGAALTVISLTLLANTYSVVDIVAMNDDYIWLRGAKKPFLDSLPKLEKK